MHTDAIDVHTDAIATMVERYGFRTVFVASDDTTVPGQLRQMLAARGFPETVLRLVTVGDGRGDMGDRSQTSSEFKEHGVPAAKWIEHRLQQGELPKKTVRGSGSQMLTAVHGAVLVVNFSARQTQRDRQTD